MFIKKNMGTADRLLRIVAALLIGVLYYFGVLNGTWATVLFVVAAVLVATSFVSVCPLYLPFGLSTRRKA